MSAALEPYPPAYVDMPRELRLKDIAELHVRVAAEVGAGARIIRVVGVESVSFGSKAALEGMVRRFAEQGIDLALGGR